LYSSLFLFFTNVDVGAGDSGKSTVAKQMQILHLDGFSHDELVQQKPLVYFNIVDSSQKLLKAARNFGISLEDVSEVRSPSFPLGVHPPTCCLILLRNDGQDDAEFMLGIDLIEDITFPGRIADCAKAIWRDAAIQATYERSAEFQLNDTAQ
jgi:hypothetical protein